MDVIKINKSHLPTLLTILVLVIMTSLFLLQAHFGFNLADEGFLWYGAKRTLAGEVPFLDFMSYDPGRYYWSATIMCLVGDNGIMTLRGAVAVFQGLGLLAALYVLASAMKNTSKHNIVFYLLASVVFVLWMFPRHKLFDISLSIFLVATLTYLITKPVLKRFFIVGICIGLVAVFGRNHGVYGATAFIGVLLWLQLKHLAQVKFLQSVTIWGLGLIVGFAPIFLMMLIIPGFSTAFVESVLFLFEQKATNLPLPVPWPWTVDYTAGLNMLTLKAMFVGIAFLLLLVLGSVALLTVLMRNQPRKPLPAAFVASAFLILPYAHFAFSRADLPHLSQSIFPLLICALTATCLSKSSVKWLLSIAVLAFSLVVMLPTHPKAQCTINGNCVSVEVASDKLLVMPKTANDIALLKRLVNQYASNGEPFIVAPIWPGAYAMFDRIAPVWEIYPLFPRAASFENKEIERIKKANPSFALLYDIALDGQEALRFKNTHPLIYQYILENYKLQNTHENASNVLYISK